MRFLVRFRYGRKKKFFSTREGIFTIANEEATNGLIATAFQPDTPYPLSELFQRAKQNIKYFVDCYREKKTLPCPHQ